MAAGTMRFLALSLFTIGMMFALHPFPREPWGVLGLGDIFTGYLFAFVGGTTYAAFALRRRVRTRATITVIERGDYRERRAA